MKRLVCLVLFSASALAQSSVLTRNAFLAQVNSATPAPVLDQSAVDVLNKSLGALGGSSPYAQNGGAITVLSQVEPVKAAHSIHAKDSWADGKVEFKREYPGIGASLVSNHGKPQTKNPHEQRPLPRHVSYGIAPFYIPGAVLYTALTDKRHSIKLIGNADLNGGSTLHIRIWDGSDVISAVQSTEDWYFDATTLLPIQVERRVADIRDGVKFIKFTILYDRWQSASGVAVPVQIIEKGPSGSRTVNSVDSVQLVHGFSPVEFEMEGAR